MRVRRPLCRKTPAVVSCDRLIRDRWSGVSTGWEQSLLLLVDFEQESMICTLFLLHLYTVLLSSLLHLPVVEYVIARPCHLHPSATFTRFAAEPAVVFVCNLDDGRFHAQRRYCFLRRSASSQVPYPPSTEIVRLRLDGWVVA